MCDRERGVSLIEVVVSIVLIGVGLAGTLVYFSSAVRGSGDPLATKQALAVAESMMEEVLLRNFANPAGGYTGAASQANRAQFDDVSDYAGFSTASVYAIDDAASAAPVLTGYVVSVAVDSGAGVDLGLPAADAKKITVTVSPPAGQGISLSAYRTSY